MLEGQYDTLFGTANLGYVSLIAVEELMEMLGMALFLYALGTYFASTVGDLRISFTDPSVTDPHVGSPRIALNKANPD